MKTIHVSEGLDVFGPVCDGGYEQIVFAHDAKTGLKAIIAIHNTQLGPSLGGCRFYPYTSQAAALTDVMRLARAMTYKASLAGLPLGGGKSVIWGDSKTEKTPELLEAFGRHVNRLGGRYITSVDSGTSSEDMDIIHHETNYVTGITAQAGGQGDPSTTTAEGTFEGIKACLKHAFGSTDLKDRKVAIQGVGHVGYPLAKLIHASGGKLLVSDVNESALQAAQAEFGAQVLSPDNMLSVQADVFAPCAMGGVVSADTLKALNVKIIAGAANNPLADQDVNMMMMEKGVLYAPDFAINAGGLIHVTHELGKLSKEETDQKTKGIFDTIDTILTRALSSQTTPQSIAEALAQERLDQNAANQTFKAV